MITYTDEYETRTAYNEVVVNEVNYVMEYFIKSPIDGKADEVNASFSQKNGDTKNRIGYGSYYQGATSVRFDSNASVPFDAQKTVNEQFMNDMEEILK